jgi:hypothetical protein
MEAAGERKPVVMSFHGAEAWRLLCRAQAKIS